MRVLPGTCRTQLHLCTINRGATRRVLVLNGYPPISGGKYPGTREYLRPFWAGICLTTATRIVPGAQILGENQVSPMPVTGMTKPGNTREYPGIWQKGGSRYQVYDIRVLIL